MKKIGAMTVLWLCLTMTVFTQTPTQTVRGTVLDADSKIPIIGASAIIPGTEPLMGTTTDENGRFRLENVPTGRISLELSYLGYETALVSNIVVHSGKEVVLNLTLRESAVSLGEVVVTVGKNKGEALNDMALLSARSISPEQTNRYAGGFNDPSRIVSNFAGVTSTQDGSNDIIIRGNSPKYVQWRLEGEQITNPNHFADQGAAGGSISTLNNNLLAASDFYTGAFPAEYGDALSGVYDVRLRAGNNEKFESVFGFGLLGTELTLEGPLKKNYGGSFIVNYRYSTVSLINDIGLVNLDGLLKFQDAAFKIVLPTKKMGVFSLYGLGGKSNFLLEDVKQNTWELPGDNGQQPGISEDFRKRAHLLNLGLGHTLPLDDKSFIKTSLTYSNEGVKDDVFESDILKIYDGEGHFIRDSVLRRTLNFSGNLERPSYRTSMTFNRKLNARHKLQVGVKYTLFDFDVTQSQLNDEAPGRFTLADFREKVGTLRSFVSWQYRAGERLTVVSGLHNLNVLYNHKSTLEPRLAVNWQLTPTAALHAGYGKHSTMEAIHHYFAKVEMSDGSITEPNKDLGLLQAHHFVLGYEQRLGKNMSAKVEAYYQRLYDLPVENNDTSYFATINEGLDFRYVDLVNEGTGKNYGVELTVERFFNHNYYFLVNASLYESKYQSLEGVERNTPYNGNYLLNVLCGKEFPKLGRKKNQTLALNAKAFFGGGRKIIPLLRDAQGNLAVEPEKGRFWDYSRAYERSLEDVYQVTLSTSYKWDTRQATHELFLNLDNVTNHKGKISEFYDEDEPGKVGYMTQFGFFPNLLYRVYF